MKKTEAKTILFTNLKPFFTSKGFKLVTTKFSGFTRKTENCFDWIPFDLKDYNPVQYVEYGVQKRINVIDKIWAEIDKVYLNVDRLYLDTQTTVRFTYEWLNGQFQHQGYLLEIRNEEDVVRNADMIIDFMTNTGLPLLEKLNDIKYIDNEINGDDFWEDDWRKPLMFGNFTCQRLIIAHLCSNKLFNRIYQFHEEKARQSLLDHPEYPVKLVNGKSPLEYLREVLSEIKPIY
jgi:hypothetical protein